MGALDYVHSDDPHRPHLLENLVSTPEQAPLFPIEPEQPTRGGGGFWRRPVSAALIVALVAAFAGAAIAHFAWTSNSTSPVAQVTNPAPSAGSGSGLNGSGGFAPSAGAAAAGTATAAAKVDPGLVDINTQTGAGPAAGTGMVVTSSGEVITNNHVISAATSITALDVGNGKTYRARVVGYDRSKDVAVIQLIGASGLATVPLGDSSTVHTGAAVVTLGNAGGVGGTPSAAGGSVSALGQAITAGDSVDNTYERLTGLIQIDGQLQPGDSGGPLVSAAGRVVGMDTAASSSFSFQSSATAGFAIPINTVLSIAKKIVAGKASNTIHIGATPLLGVEIYPSTSGQGVPIAYVVSGGPADRAGITAGSTITAFNGHAVATPDALVALKDRHHPGDRVSVTWVDQSGVSHTATLTLSTGPSD